MDIKKIILQVSSKPAFRLIGVPDGDKEAAIAQFCQSAVDRIAQSHDFNFTIGEAAETTVVNVGDYNLKGDSDCREVINIKYGPDEILLRKLEAVDYDIDSQVYEAPDTPLMWYEIGLENGHPQVRILATPQEAVSLKYRYRRKNIPLEDYPEEWTWVLVRFIMAELADVWKDKSERWVTYDFEAKAQQGIMQMIRDYRKEGGGSPKYIQQDPIMRVQNIRRNSLYGYR